MLKYIILGALGAVVALMVYVRLAPINAADWHRIDLPVGNAGAMIAAGSHTVLHDVQSATRALETFDAIIMVTPRTIRVAGSVEDGRITYVTRSRVFGFPDYTTVTARPADAAGGATMDTLAIYGRLRFGKADMGINRARIEGWLGQFDAAQNGAQK